MRGQPGRCGQARGGKPDVGFYPTPTSGSASSPPDVWPLHLSGTCRGPRLRAAVASALRARNAPQLVFRHDGLTPQQQEVEELLARLDAEAAAEAEAAAAAAEHVDAGKDEDATALQGWEEGLEEQPLDSTQAEQRQRWWR